MKVNRNDHKTDTTLGDLIVTIGDVAFESSDDTKDAYNLAHLVLVEILQGATLRSEIVDRHFSWIKYLH